jgi:hypothetical protein
MNFFDIPSRTDATLVKSDFLYLIDAKSRADQLAFRDNFRRSKSIRPATHCRLSAPDNGGAASHVLNKRHWFTEVLRSVFLY